MKKIAVLIGIFVVFFSGCSSYKTDRGYWVLEQGPGFKIDFSKGRNLQYKKLNLNIPIEILFSDNSVSFKLVDNALYQEATYEDTSNGFIVHTISDNKYTIFQKIDDYRIATEWKGKTYIYRNSLYLRKDIK